MAKEATARRRKPEKKVDFIKRNFETMTYREMSEHIGLSPSRIYEIAHHKLKLPPKERKVPTYPFKCEGCGKEEQRTSRRRAAVALCDECRPPVKPGIGKRAYLMRHATHQPWEKITTAVGSLSTQILCPVGAALCDPQGPALAGALSDHGRRGQTGRVDVQSTPISSRVEAGTTIGRFRIPPIRIGAIERMPSICARRERKSAPFARPRDRMRSKPG